MLFHQGAKSIERREKKKERSIIIDLPASMDSVTSLLMYDDDSPKKVP